MNKGDLERVPLVGTAWQGYRRHRPQVPAGRRQRHSRPRRSSVRDWSAGELCPAAHRWQPGKCRPYQILGVGFPRQLTKGDSDGMIQPAAGKGTGAGSRVNEDREFRLRHNPPPFHESYNCQQFARPDIPSTINKNTSSWNPSSLKSCRVPGLAWNGGPPYWPS